MTQPTCCPACGAAIIKTTATNVSKWTDYECGLVYRQPFDEPKATLHTECTRAFSAAVSLRRERDEARAQVENWRKRIEAHMDYTEPKIDRVQANVDRLTAERDSLRVELERARAAHDELKQTYEGLNAYSMRQSFEITELRAELARLREQLTDAYKLLELTDIPHDGAGMRAALSAVVGGIDHARAQEFDSWEPGNVERESEK